MPYISILVSVYNSEKYLITALDSIPVRDDIEVIIANDGSTDNSLNLLLHYNRFKFTLLNFKENHGIGYIRNHLVKMATGK